MIWPSSLEPLPLSPSSLSSSYIAEIIVFLPSGGKEWLVFSGTGEDQVHLIINLHTPSDLSSSHPPGSNMCISLRQRGIIGPFFSPWPSPTGLCGDPELIYEPKQIGPKWVRWFAKCDAWLRFGTSASCVIVKQAESEWFRRSPFLESGCHDF